MQEEVRFFAPIFEGIPFNSFAVGGGTPSLMTATQLKRFCGSALDAFQLPEEGLRSVELHPATTDGSKLRALRELGFKRVSFGVQSMTPETLRRINRRQSFAAVQAAIHGAKTAGFEVVNADMIFGFVGEPLESFLKSFRQVAAIHPTEITVTILSPTEKYMKATRTTQETYRRYYDDNLMPAFEGVMGIARRMGYQMPANADPKNREWLVVDPACPLDRNTYCQETGRRMASMLGLGRGSRSWIFGRRAYERDWEKFSPKAAIFQVASMSLKEEMAIFILQQLESGSRLAYVDFQERFGLDVREMFPSELKILKAFGQISLDAESFHYLPRGVHHRVFWATVFALDAFPSLPCAAGLFDGDLRARLEDELVGVDLCLSAA
ncbi:MAG: hypothetical protein A2X40_10875 [Elusimicrobia bacterium GWC2_65_9]|nr:MAG: hypothetical protein A2X40_10875 [Elusimicrobia bacterium GWC2_65_9]